MRDYVIFTDSACDIHPDLLAQWGVKMIDLKFRFEDMDREMTNVEMPIDKFYAKMREGGVSKTSAANPDDFREAFENVLNEGNDILYLGFSSGLSNTYNASNIAADELREQFPDRKIITIDTLCASAGEGLMVYLAKEEKAKGEDMDAVAALVNEKIPHLCHWFTVDSLVYLKRGGRVSTAAAFFGGVLDIKPVLHVDDVGHLINVSKVRGRKNSLKAMVNQYEALAEDVGGTYFISNGGCPDDARLLESMIEEKFGHKAAHIADIGPVIGSHSGPGTMALFFLGKHR